MATQKPSTLPPSTHKQSSRKGKKAWRKNVDLTPLEAGLDEARTQLITGGIIRELPADALFVTDTSGSAGIQKTYTKNHKHRTLKADEILKERSALPGLVGAKRPSDGVEGGSAKKRNSLSGKEYHRLRHIAYGGQSVHKEIVKPSGDASYDPWESAEVVVDNYDFVGAKGPAQEPATLKAQPISLAVAGKRVRGVRKPATEKSYNPSAVDCLHRFERLGASEIVAEQKRLHVIAVEEDKLAKIAAADAEEEEGEWESEWESEWEGIASGVEDVLPEWSVKKRPERKTKVQRNKLSRRKAVEGLLKHEAYEKVKKIQSERIKKLAREVVETEKQREEANLVEVKEEASDEGSGDEFEMKRIRPFGKAP
jgi:nucleolar protein 53